MSKLREIGRLNAFTDGVMVVAMTLLVLDIRVPDHLDRLDGIALLHALGELWPKFFGYLLSFVVIAQYWLGYTQKFGEMRSADTSFAWLNIYLLLFIGFIPFVTSLLGENGGTVATSFYAATMVLVSSWLCLMWLYARRHGFLESEFTVREHWRELVPWLQVAGVFGASIIVAQFHPDFAKMMWVLVAIPLKTRKPKAAGGT